MHSPHPFSAEVLMEATELTAFVLEVPVGPTLDALALATNDEFTMDMILGIANHVCALRARRANPPIV